jgi:tRNA dimethylallyltransferase
VSEPTIRGIALVGSTASGKSALAHEFAKQSNGSVEIICVDAMTVYRHMNLGTSKPSTEEQSEVRYHCLDLVEPFEEFTVSEFQKAARSAREDIVARGGVTLYVGGTGLYGRAVIDNLEIPGQFPSIKEELVRRASEDLAALYTELETLDPVAASRMEPTNERRIVRALEVTLGSGRAFSSYGEGLTHYPANNVMQIGLDVDFAELDVKIEQRFRQWMDLGLLDEIAYLHALPQGLSKTARQAVGYKELLRHFEEGVELELCVQEAIIQSRRLARRQRSWFRRDPRVEWYSDQSLALERLREVRTDPKKFVRD